jgi:Fe-S oxidoreductase
LERCPHDIDMPKVMRAIRRMLVEFDSYPAQLRDAVARIQSEGNPFGEPREERTQFTDECEVPAFAPTMDYLLFRCCTAAYDPAAKRAAQAIIRTLQRSECSFGTLSANESCCGESARRAGAEDAFTEVAGANVAEMRDVGARKVLTTSPHCYVTFVRDYQQLNGAFEVRHYTQVLAELLEAGRLKPTRTVAKKVVYHDPCTLGRQSGVFEEPRAVLRSIPGLELVEFPHFNRQDSYCCGGGSGGAWLERPKGERMSDVRVQQAIETGADVLAVACPYCHQMFEDSVRTMGASIEVRDVGELLDEAMEG